MTTQESSPVTRRRFLGISAAAGLGMLAADTAAPQNNPPLIIDAHVHLKHGDVARTEYSPETIVATMDKAGIAKSVVFAMSTSTQRSIEMAESAVKRYPDRLIPYVYALPNYERPVIKEIEQALSTRGFRGIKIHVGECTLADYVVDPVLKLAGKCGVPCLIDCGGKYDAAKRMAEKFPDTFLIIAHMGRYLCTDKKLVETFIGLAESCRNVFLDVSGVVLLDMIEEAVRRIGSSRLIWGSDGPDKKPDTVSYACAELAKIQHLSLSDKDKNNILGQTILSLLRL